MVTWIQDAWKRIETETAYFPKGMKLSGLQDTAYFSHPHNGLPTLRIPHHQVLYLLMINRDKRIPMFSSGAEESSV